MQKRALSTIGLAATLAIACAPGSGGGEGGAGGGGGAAGSSGRAGATSQSGSGGVGSAGTTSGGASGSGGSSVGGAGGGLANGGSSGAAGTGGSEDPFTAAEVLDGLAILKPCVDSFVPSGNADNSGDCCCEELAENENQHLTRQFGGDPNVTYDVTLRIAGVAERYWYSGGALDPSGGVFYTGGLPTIHGAAAPNDDLAPGQGACKVRPPETDGQYALPFTVPEAIRPEDGCYNGFNVFALTVSSPAQSYYLNFTTDVDGDRPPHSVYETDYTVTIPITGQATLDLYTIDGDHHQVTNNGTMSVPDVETPQPYNGNFLEFTVVEVTVAN